MLNSQLATCLIDPGNITTTTRSQLPQGCGRKPERWHAHGRVTLHPRGGRLSTRRRRTQHAPGTALR
eukprot:355490-Chlamydomonas_euryale.AAC.12